MKLHLALIRCQEDAQNAGRPSGLPQASLVYTGTSACCSGTAARFYPRSLAVLLEDLCDFDYGAFAGRSADELARDGRFQSWGSAAGSQPCPDGESAYGFAVRCGRALRTVTEEMCAKGIAETALIAHAAVLGALLRRCCLPRSLYRDWRTSPGEGYLLEYDSLLGTAKILRSL